MTETRPATIAPEVKRVLVPTDFSPGAATALNWAHAIAKGFNAELVLLHALDLTMGAAAGLPSDVAMMPVVQQLADRLREEAEADMAKLGTLYPAARRIIREGLPRQTILDVAKTEAANLIVMGTHGRTGLAQMLFGSVAEHVVRHSPIPVLTVRHQDAAAGTASGTSAG